jgi:hypothetical protein
MPIAGRRQKILGWLCGAALFLGSVGCFGPSSSALERGEPLTTGQQRFDDYFAQVAALRDKVQGFDSDLFPVRQPLTEQLGLNSDASMRELMAKVRERADKLRSFGLTMGLVLSPTPKVVTQKGKLDADVEDERVVLAVEDSAKRAYTTFKEFGELARQAATLDAQRGGLAEHIDKLDATDPNRGVIEDEIVAAGRVLEQAQDKLLKDSRTLGLYLMWLSEAVDTGAAASQDKECEQAIAGKPPTKKPGKPVGPLPKGPPARPPGGGDDFEM